jgi:hypothetical protein
MYCTVLDIGMMDAALDRDDVMHFSPQLIAANVQLRTASLIEETWVTGGHTSEEVTKAMRLFELRVAEAESCHTPAILSLGESKLGVGVAQLSQGAFAGIFDDYCTSAHWVLWQ